MYAVVDIESRTKAVLRSPFRQDIERALASPSRLVLGDNSVIHVSQAAFVAFERELFGADLAVFHIAFSRDESCSLAALLQLRNVYAWLVMPRQDQTPPEWLCSLYRFVQHPTYDFQGLDTRYFRVRAPWELVEPAVEAACWSKLVDWAPAMASTDLHATVLRQIFDTLCHSHPPGLGVDSVKFSKLLYEAKIQPALLSIGDAAFLFASNIMVGSSYEMGFDGFVRAIEWLAQRFYSDKKPIVGKTSPTKPLPGIQHAMLQWRAQHGVPACRERLQSPLRRFCFETLVHLPSLAGTWREIMNAWRLASKQPFLQAFAVRYCAATRLQACWVGFMTWKNYLQRRQRMKEERCAATKLQSVVRARRNYVEYSRVHRIVVRTQRRVHARAELRRLRAERAAFIERMRLRLVKWMRYHLWVLREWKRLNPSKVARRERIRQKRLRRLGVAVFPLDSRLVRFSLYRANVEPSSDETTEHDEAYELEVLDATHSWGQVFNTSQRQLELFTAQELARAELQEKLGFSALSKTTAETRRPDQPQNSLRRRNQTTTLEERDSVVYPTSKPGIAMLALARRLSIQKDPSAAPTLCCYSDPVDTSLGKVHWLRIC